MASITLTHSTLYPTGPLVRPELQSIKSAIETERTGQLKPTIVTLPGASPSLVVVDGVMFHPSHSLSVTPGHSLAPPFPPILSQLQSFPFPAENT